MESQAVHAIVLRRRDAGESDRRLTLFTLEEGKIEAVAKGARKAGSRLAGCSEPLMASVLLLAPGRRSRFITQAQPQSSFRGLRSDFDRLSLGLALLELYEAVVPWQSPQPDIYELLLRSLHALESHPNAEVAAVWTQLALLKASGVMPQFDECVVTGKAVAGVQPWLSPSAGGHVAASQAEFAFDGFQARNEVVVGLAKTALLDEPPPHLRHARECLFALHPFWRHFADTPLPTLDACLNELRSQPTPPSLREAASGLG